MANFDNIKRRVDDEKQDMIANMDEAALKDFIHESCRNYYVDFMNDNVNDFNATVSILEYIKKNAEYDNIRNFINYSMIIAINTILNNLMDRKMDLIMPDVVELTADNVEGRQNFTKYTTDEVKNFLKKLDDIKEDR